MARSSNPTNSPTNRVKAAIEVTNHDAVAVVKVTGLVDEHFTGFGQLSATAKSVVIEVSGITRMTSFGVRQWLKGMDALPKTISDVYLLGCPTFFVDQLNMVLNFGGGSQILTVVAPYTCPSCGQDSVETIDVLAGRAALIKGSVPEKMCGRCGGKLEFDETPESYFSFAGKYAASTIDPAAAQVLAQLGIYTAVADSAGEKPPKIIKLVRGSVTYFRISGTIGAMFRARPFLVGAEGEVVLDLAEIERFDASGQREWRRLLKNLAGQVSSVTLVDINDSFLANVADSMTFARTIYVWSVLLTYGCIDCGRTSHVSQPLEPLGWPPQFTENVCSVCGGTTRNEFPVSLLAPLQKAITAVPAASARLVEQREEVLSRELTDAHVAQAGDNATAALGADDKILGKYKIVRRLSSGGMADVFLAKQVGIGGFEKPVALKRIQRQLLEQRHLAIDMFLNEAKIAGRLMHTNIVQVLDVGENGGALYLAMEYVKGKDLREIMKLLREKGGSVPLGEACFIVRDVAQALHHAYWSTDMSGSRLSVVHRDVSPHNVIVSHEGVVKLLDFGVAMSAVTEQEQAMIVGKWPYMSPEHTTPAKLDHRSDLFSLGVLLYLLVSGALPFVDNNHREIVRKIRAGQFTPLHIAVPGTPQPLSDLVSSLLSPNPEDRPQTGQDVASHLTEIARAFGVERSSADIVRFLRELYPDDFGDSGSGNLERISAQWIRQTGIQPLSPSTMELPIAAPPPGTPVARVTSPGIAVARTSSTMPRKPTDSDVMPTIVADAPPDLPELPEVQPGNIPPPLPAYASVPAPQPQSWASPPLNPVPQHPVPDLRRSQATILIVIVLVIAAGLVAYFLVH